MNTKKFILPEAATASEIKHVRKKLGLTQKNFAELAGCSKSTIERWETSKELISGPIVLLLQLLDKEPEFVRNIKVPPQVYPGKLCYMHN
ncbi:MAG: type II toxin-antitoxin system MqsA family antitoxin [Eubacteriales bacterium]|nr:type II toxin-antitoxin system MqsA family antitoxin [Eubacteriales bacterium]